jgi:hypothetical protein
LATNPRIDFAPHIAALQAAADATAFRIFLCGPKLSLHKKDSAAAVRKQLMSQLEKENFEVVLGEDEGLTDKKISDLGINAQDNELLFIKDRCNAVILVAGSVGSYCELGLFSWHFSQGMIDGGKIDFILLVDKKYRKHKSYFNLGPLTAVRGGKGAVHFVDFKTVKFDNIIKRLKAQRGITRAGKALRRKK